MIAAPAPHSVHVFRSAEVALVLRLAQPASLARCFACLPASLLGAVSLLSALARIRNEPRFTAQTPASPLSRSRHMIGSRLTETIMRLARRNPVGRLSRQEAGARRPIIARRCTPSPSAGIIWAPALLRNTDKMTHDHRAGPFGPRRYKRRDARKLLIPERNPWI